MPRNDTWRGRDAHQALAEGLDPWRVGWSGPGRIGGGGSRRRAGPCRSPKLKGTAVNRSNGILIARDHRKRRLYVGWIDTL